MKEFLVWWIGIEAVGLAAFPLTYAFLRWLPDRGFAFSKVIGRVSFAMHRDLLVTCLLSGSFNGFYLAIEDTDAPDPDTSNNSTQIDPVTVVCTPP